MRENGGLGARVSSHGLYKPVPQRANPMAGEGPRGIQWSVRSGGGPVERVALAGWAAIGPAYYRAVLRAGTMGRVGSPNTNALLGWAGPRHY